MTLIGGILLMFLNGSYFVWFNLSPYAVSYLYYINPNQVSSSLGYIGTAVMNTSGLIGHTLGIQLFFYVSARVYFILLIMASVLF